MTESIKGQMSIFDFLDQDIWSGKMCQERSAQTKGKISEPSLKKRQKLQTKMPLFLNLQKDKNGHQVDASWEMGGVLLGEYMMRSFGEFPNEERESLLSQILEDTPHPKYFLSARACQGILRRAEKRGKELPPILKEALLKQSASLNELDVKGGARVSSYNMNELQPCQPSTTKVSFSQDAYDKYTESDQSATIKQSGGVYGGGSEALVIQ